MSDEYRAFLEQKICVAAEDGFRVDPSEVNPILKQHQIQMVVWACRGGRRAIFAAFGLGKSVIQIEIVRLVLKHLGSGRGLIVIPLGVRQEFIRDAKMLGVPVTFLRRTAEMGGDGIYLTNYESIRDGKLSPSLFVVASLDEASCLRGFGGSKTFREFIRKFAPAIRYRFLATATPSPNEYIELLAYSAFLDIMDVGQAKTRFFKRDSTKADSLTIHPHKEREFWLWVASWGLFVQRPSDIGCRDDGYVLPPMHVHYHEVRADIARPGVEKSGQGILLRPDAVGVVDASREKRDTMPARIAAMMNIVNASPDDRFILWHDLEAERHAIQKAVPSALAVYGSQDLDEREGRIIGFSEGQFQYLSAKPVVAGSGCNFQRHCHKAIFLGIGFKFNDFIQAIHRIQRFLQDKPVEIHIVYAESERAILRILQAKWHRHESMVGKMTEIIREFGLSSAAMVQSLTRAMGVERVEVSGPGYCLVHGDTVPETRNMAPDSVDLIVSSLPFGTQYEYSPNYCDFGHTDDNDHFWRQMDFLTPHLLRVLRPGRVAAIHVKDRITPGGINGLGFQTVNPFSDETVAHFRKHGFAFLARKTVVTDVVRENNQTYRLGWTEQCKDGSRMGCGMPEYVLLFRKPPTDLSDGYADNPVIKDKKLWNSAKGTWDFAEGYSRARWQMDAHGFARSSGDRLLCPADIVNLKADQIFKLFRDIGGSTIYDFEHHVELAEALEKRGQLPPTFMLLQPASWHPDVWTDITRMLTLNGQQHAKGQELHLCPLQFDIVDRLILQLSMKGETVFDPFGGLMTVPYRALKFGRQGRAHELDAKAFLDGVAYVEAMAREIAVPSLFDMIGESHRADAA